MAFVNRMFVVALLAGMAIGSAHQTAGQGKVPNASIGRVIDMLDNLVAEMQAEQRTDDGTFAAFSEWCTHQKAVTSASIEDLQALIEELGAKLAGLYSQKTDLQAVIASLNQQIEETQNQIQIATEKRGEEHDSFLTEQQNFDASIAACGRAVDVLKTHYGEPAKPMEKPSWIGLVQQAVATLKKTVALRKMKVQPHLLAFLQSPNNDRYQDSSGEANDIVTQMSELSDTFSSDKESSISEENKLQGMYGTLMQEKTAMLNTLNLELNSRQAVLNQVLIDIAQTEGAKSAADSDLANEQGYLSQITKSCADGKTLYEMRKGDRLQETVAVNEATKVLAPQGGAALMEVALETRRSLSGGASSNCKNCAKAAALLLQASRTYSSEILATAAQTATNTENDALKDIVGALDKLIARLDQDQDMEDKHKSWCEVELAETTQRKTTHEAEVQKLSQSIADLTETIAEKVQAIQDNVEAIQTADTNFAQATKIRDHDHAEYETELGNYVEALSALNKAIDVLAKFYSSKDAASSASLMQAATEKVAPREVAPGMFSGVYEQKGGKGVIQMIATVRTEFETGKRDLEAAEKQSVEDFFAAKASYEATRRDLVTQGDKLTVEKQTAENQMEQAKEDKANNEQEIASAQAYLAQLGGSCDMLLKNHDSRKQQRAEEKTAIQQAKKVLEEEA